MLCWIQMHSKVIQLYTHTYTHTHIYILFFKQFFFHLGYSAEFSPQMCMTLWDPMNYSTPGFPLHHQLLELAQTHVHRVSNAIQPSHPVICLSSHLQSFPASGSFPVTQFFTSGGQRFGASVSASVLPMNIRDWFPLGLTGLISLQFKGLSRVFSNTIVQKHQFFGTQLSL